MALIKESGATIYAPGDMSVGIFPASWKIAGELVFENESDREEFREAMRQTFGLQAEFVTMQFDSEIAAENAKCEAMEE